MSKEKEFLERLSALTSELGIAIGGCGCCGSPYLYEVDKRGSYGLMGTEQQLQFSIEKKE